MSMRSRYWSHSKVASAIRRAFKLPPLLWSGTSEQWDEFNKQEQEISPLGVKLIDSLDTIQNIVYFIPDTINKALYYIHNVLSSSHMLRTRAQMGSWSDLTAKIPDALMLSIIDFIEKECFHMNSICLEKDAVVPSDVKAYSKQSYIRRKLFPVKVTEAHRGQYGLEYILFQRSHCGEEQQAHYDALIAAYKFAKGRFQTFDVYEESGWNLLPHEDIISLRATESQRKCFIIMRKLEESFEEELTEHCTNLVKYRAYLWT